MGTATVPVAIDSNILWPYLGGDPMLREAVQSVDRVWMPVPVLGEAWFAVLNSAGGRSERNRANLERFLRTCHVPEMGQATALRYAEIRIALRRKGRPISHNDIWIAATCIEHGVPLATRDRDVDHVNGLQILR